MTYVFDIDGTICTKTTGDYSEALPLQERIDKINQLHEEGHKIIFLTARGMGRSDNSSSYAHNAFYNLTRQQLIECIGSEIPLLVSWQARRGCLY